MNHMLFGFRLRTAILEHGMNQRSFAEKIGLGEPALSHIIQGLRQPRLKLICQMLEHLPNNTFESLVKK